MNAIFKAILVLTLVFVFSASYGWARWWAEWAEAVDVWEVEAEEWEEAGAHAQWGESEEAVAILL